MGITLKQRKELRRLMKKGRKRTAEDWRKLIELRRRDQPFNAMPKQEKPE